MPSNYLCNTKHQSDEKPEFIRVFQYKDILMVPGIWPLLIISKPPADFFFFNRNPERLRSKLFRAYNVVTISSSLKSVCRRKIKLSTSGILGLSWRAKLLFFFFRRQWLTREKHGYLGTVICKITHISHLIWSNTSDNKWWGIKQKVLYYLFT